MKIILVNPPIGDIYENKNKKQTLRPAMGLAYLASALLNEDIETEIFDSVLEKKNADETAEYILDHNYDVIGITSTTPTFPYAVQISQSLKKLDNKVKIILGGPHTSFLPDESLKESGADYVCMGESEETLPQLINYIYSKTTELPDKVVVPEMRAFKVHYRETKELDKILIPARQLLKNSKYIDENKYCEYVPTATVMTSRGCMGHCKFCQGQLQKTRLCSLAYVVNELEEIVNQYGIKNIFFADDTFTTNKKRLFEIFDKIKQKKLEISYACHIRLDTVDEEVCQLLKTTGCISVRPGIESGNDDILRNMGKNITTDTILEKVELLHKYGISIRATYMFGWVNETYEQMIQTIEFASKVNTSISSFSIVTPLPGTWLWNYGVRIGKIRKPYDFTDFKFYKSIACNFSKVTDNQLLELQEYANDKFQK